MRRASGGVLLAALALHALVTKLPHGQLPEMLYACHVATAVMAIGLLANRPALAGVGFLFHLSIGFWAYLLDLCAARTTTPTSVLVHVLPLVFGFRELRRTALPRWTPFAAFGLFAILLPVSYFATPPALNVNLSHRPWPPVARFMPGLWITWAANLTGALVCLLLGDALLRRARGQRAALDVEVTRG
jgi:hypothetical protein